MPTPREVSRQFRHLLLTQDEQAALRILEAYTSTVGDLDARITEIASRVATLKAQGKAITPTLIYEDHRIKAQLAELGTQFRAFADKGNPIVQEMALKGAELGNKASIRLIKVSLAEALPGFEVPPEFLGFNPAAVEEVVALYGEGSPYFKTAGEHVSGAANVFQRVFVDAVVSGQNPLAVVPELRRGLDLPVNSLRTASRTVLISAYREASLRNYNDNSDVVKGWEWSCAKSDRTCPVCLAMDGRQFPLDAPFASHLNCRCSPVPVVRSWEEMGFPASESPEDAPTDSGEVWFDRQPKATKEKIVGKAGLEAINSGQLTLKSFVGLANDETYGDYRYRRNLSDMLSDPNPTEDAIGQSTLPREQAPADVAARFAALRSR